MELIVELAKHPLMQAASALFLGLLGFWFMVARDRLADRREAARMIADAFLPELTALRQRARIVGVGQILTEEALNRHQSAVNNYADRLSWCHAWRVRRRWRRLTHQNHGGMSHGPSYHWYFDGGSVDRREELVGLSIERMQALISTLNR